MSQENKIKLKNDIVLKSAGGQFLDPSSIVAQLELHPGMQVAHFGCGTGFFTFPIATRIGENGKIWALDILEHKLELVRAQAKNLGLGNVIVKKANLEKQNGSELENASVDWVVMVNMLHQNDKKSDIINEAKRVLKEKGKILFIEWKNENATVGPKMNIRVTRKDVLEIAKKNDFEIIQEIDAGKFFFGMILAKK